MLTIYANPATKLIINSKVNNKPVGTMIYGATKLFNNDSRESLKNSTLFVSWQEKV
jgi:hypothetical protein